AAPSRTRRTRPDRRGVPRLRRAGGPCGGGPGDPPADALLPAVAGGPAHRPRPRRGRGPAAAPHRPQPRPAVSTRPGPAPPPSPPPPPGAPVGTRRRARPPVIGEPGPVTAPGRNRPVSPRG